jgi:hypothetical protein
MEAWKILLFNSPVDKDATGQRMETLVNKDIKTIQGLDYDALSGDTQHRVTRRISSL